MEGGALAQMVATFVQLTALTEALTDRVEQLEARLDGSPATELPSRNGHGAPADSGAAIIQLGDRRHGAGRQPVGSSALDDVDVGRHPHDIGTRRAVVEGVAVEGLRPLLDRDGGDLVDVLDFVLQAVCTDLLCTSCRASQETAPSLTVVGALVGGLFGVDLDEDRDDWGELDVRDDPEWSALLDGLRRHGIELRQLIGPAAP